MTQMTRLTETGQQAAMQVFWACLQDGVDPFNLEDRLNWAKTKGLTSPVAVVHGFDDEALAILSSNVVRTFTAMGLGSLSALEARFGDNGFVV